MTGEKASVLVRLSYRAYHTRYYKWLGLLSRCRFRLGAYLSGVKVGRGPQIWGRCRIIRFPGSRIEIGDYFHCVADEMRASSAPAGMVRIRTFSEQANVVIGNHVGLNGTSIVCRNTEVRIGDSTKIAPGCLLSDTDFHGIEPGQRLEAFPEHDRPVIVGRNVWIGMRCIILKGVTIGDNAVVGAGSVVTRDIEPNSVWAGNPARFIRSIVEQP